MYCDGFFAKATLLSHSMGTTLSLQRSHRLSHSRSCIHVHGMCVAPNHGLIMVTDHDTMQLRMYSLADWSLVRTIGVRGSGREQFHFRWGGLCVSSDGDSVLVAEWGNHRVQQVRIVDGAWVRFVGEGVLEKPDFVDCNGAVIAVSEWACHRISVLSWADGRVRARFGSYGSVPGQLRFPRGVRLLADGSGLAVADSWNHRLCVFTLNGGLVAAGGSREQGMWYSCDVLECVSDGGFIVANFYGKDLVKCSRHDAKIRAHGEKGDIAVQLPSALSLLPDGGIVVRDKCGLSIVRDRLHRLQWIGVCVSAWLRHAESTTVLAV